MGLPPRQQQMLNQIEQVLQAADPRLKSMFAAFARMAPRDDEPATEVISSWTVWRKLVVGAVVVSMLGSTDAHHPVHQGGLPRPAVGPGGGQRRRPLRRLSEGHGRLEQGRPLSRRVLSGP